MEEGFVIVRIVGSKLRGEGGNRRHVSSLRLPLYQRMQETQLRFVVATMHLCGNAGYGHVKGEWCPMVMQP